MVVIVDSDCIRKLAYCNFLGEFLQLIQTPPNDVWVLPAVEFQLRKKLNDCQGALADFEKFFKKVKPIPKATTAMLARFECLDGGEQQIFALMCEIDRVELIVTGDKVAMKRVAELVHKDPELGALVGGSTVWCFETIVLRLVQRQGFSIAMARMNLWRERQGDKMDKSMSSIFVKGCTEQSVTSGLTTSIQALRASCVGVPIRS